MIMSKKAGEFSFRVCRKVIVLLSHQTAQQKFNMTIGMQSEFNRHLGNALSTEDAKLLTEPMYLHVGAFVERGMSHEFEIEVDGRPLALMIEDAFRGHRVYELLSINRPGDLLNYLWVRVADGSTHLVETVTVKFKRTRRFLKPPESVRELAFTEFDGYFRFEYDDTQGDASRWLDYRDSADWRQQFAKLLPLVKQAQESLKKKVDFLIQHEVALMVQGHHHLDFCAIVVRDGQLASGVPAETTLSQDLFALIVRLSKQKDVRSISCPFTDYWLWRELVGEQVRRSIAQEMEPMEALRLNGPDGGIPFVKAGPLRVDLEWGGEVHIPCEGACGGDLFVQPDWFSFSLDDARTASSLSVAVFGHDAHIGVKTCKYLLTRGRNLGDISCADRTVVGDWFLYSEKVLGGPI